MSEIIYVCKSTNNKNVREGELKILRKSRDNDLCFEFGANEMFLKKRFYNNEKDFKEDFENLQNLKKQAESKIQNTMEINKIDDSIIDRKNKKIIL